MRNRRLRHRNVVVFGVTAAISARLFLDGHLASARTSGREVHLVVGESGAEKFAASQGAQPHVVNMRREPHVWADLVALIQLLALLSTIKPSTVVFGTPKMGLLGILASRFAGVPNRVYVLHGLRSEGARGPLAAVLYLLELLTHCNATQVITVSHSLRRQALQRKLAPPQKVVTVGAGSANGIDIARFTPPQAHERSRARNKFNIPQGAKVIAYVGRLNADKGLGMMVQTYAQLRSSDTDAWLLLVGAVEATTDAERSAVAVLDSFPQVVRLPHIEDVLSVYHCADLLWLFTKREGLPTVVLEAAATGIPTIATIATGTTDAVSHGHTGILVEQDEVSVAAHMTRRLLHDQQLNTQLGEAARLRVVRHFNRDLVTAQWSRHLYEANALSSMAAQSQN
ncbi:glycosyltransferase [Knoellia sp. p5-6-4]|uniref:glycosyltransferase n=1 Tax=unclassified Knoellia TaxID=2618719 RepID=UPI0023DCE008|nr:glycosyltransferase [Knoellia sp. p5-6-4]MDF2144154.1 glycosyltransferase [Knoellia sp. p5-6-4]